MPMQGALPFPGLSHLLAQVSLLLLGSAERLESFQSSHTLALTEYLE